ncbi:glycosyltransferase family 4 protein [Phenylobacterium sp.]|uniref:glycosyltransferase family 4 protein n=1 Tax=Phenylobacterium sp. TaxID=1871053 RepID=UPI0030F3E8A4
MRILFLSHYYPPESNAPANRVSELAGEWAALGHDVTVVTCTPSHPGGRPYPGYGNPLLYTETLDGVEVIRLGTFLAANQGTIRRSLNYLSFLAAVVLNLPRLPKADVVISTSPQFFAGLSGAIVAKAKRSPFILEIRDIWPESASAVAALKKGLAFRVLETIEAWAYGVADQVVAVSPAFVEHISKRGKLRRPVAIVENGVNLNLFDGQTQENDFRARHGLEGKIVFGYVGTHGMAHNLETLLRAAELTRDDPEIAYLMAGSGAQRSKLVALRDELGLTNVVMLDHQPRSEMPTIWSNTDVSLVLLRRSPLFHRVIPSKMFEAMAMSRPIILAVDGQARAILEAGDCGIFVEPEDPEALATTVRRLSADIGLRSRLGANGKSFVRANYNRRVLAERYLRIIESVAAPRPAG